MRRLNGLSGEETPEISGKVNQVRVSPEIIPVYYNNNRPLAIGKPSININS
jgi:hypothetical protein